MILLSNIYKINMTKNGKISLNYSLKDYIKVIFMIQISLNILSHKYMMQKIKSNKYKMNHRNNPKIN